jgi:hypothetical protein
MAAQTNDPRKLGKLSVSVTLRLFHSLHVFFISLLRHSPSVPFVAAELPFRHIFRKCSHSRAVSNLDPINKWNCLAFPRNERVFLVAFKAASRKFRKFFPPFRLKAVRDKISDRRLEREERRFGKFCGSED